jgi:hypothetical protein
VKVGGALLAVAWAPFLYAELSSDSAEQKERALPADAAHDDTSAVQAIEAAHEPAAGKDAPAPAPVAEAPAAAAPAAVEPTAPAAAAAPVAPSAVPAAAPANGPGAQQVQQLAVRPGQPLATGTPAPAPGDTKDPPPEGSDDLAAAAEPQEEDEPDPTPPTPSGPAEALKQAYDQQPRDPLWAADAEGKISALFGTDEVPGDLLRSASCRKAVCRVELRWTTAHATAYVNAYEAAQQLLGGEVGVEPVGAPSDKGEQLVNLYLTRKGYTVADLSR